MAYKGVDCPDMYAASCGVVRWLELSVAVDWFVFSSEGFELVSWAGAVGAMVDDDGGS